jgi:hypothetical protein
MSVELVLGQSGDQHNEESTLNAKFPCNKEPST